MSFTMYSTPWCGYCHRLKGQLDREGISYEVVDIEQPPEAALIVEQVNNGNQTVPTLVFADGSAQTNPSLAQIKDEARLPRLTGPASPAAASAAPRASSPSVTTRSRLPSVRRCRSRSRPRRSARLNHRASATSVPSTSISVAQRAGR